jgi:hypothetical protein
MKKAMWMCSVVTVWMLIALTAGLPKPALADVNDSITKDPGAPIQRDPLDEGCLAAGNVVIRLNATHDHSQVAFWAPQQGIYRIYGTTNPNHVGNPPGVDWTLLDSVTVGIPLQEYLWQDPAALGGYKNYALIHVCPVPANDNCANAMLIIQGSYPFSTIGATTDGPSESQCNNFGDSQVNQDIWFRYVATCSGPLTVSLCGSNFDTKVAFYATSNCPTSPNTAVSCNDDYCSLQSQLVANVIAGFTYIIRVGGFSNNFGTGTLTVHPGFGNDLCSAPLTVTAGSTDFVTNCAQTDGPVENFNGNPQQLDGDLWFRYTSPVCGNVTVSLCGSSFDTELAIYLGTTCPQASGTALVTNDDFCGIWSQATFPALADSVYLIRVGGYAGDYGSGTLAITEPTAPNNDDCANALFIGQQTLAFNTTNACTDGPFEGSYFCYPQKDLWYSYTAPYCGTVTVDLCGSSFDTEVAVYHGTCGNLGSPIACNDDNSTCSPTTRSYLQFLTIDSGPYLIRVGGYGSSYGAGVITVSQTQDLLVFDDCTGAWAAGYGVDTVYTNCAGTGSDTSACGQIYHDVWLSLVPPANTTTTISTCGSPINTRLAVYYTAISGCNSLSEVACSDDYCGTGSQVQFSVGQFVFGAYLIRVGGATFNDLGEIIVTRAHN